MHLGWYHTGSGSPREVAHIFGAVKYAPDGKTLNWFATTAFDFRITPQGLAEAAGRLSAPLPTSRPPTSE